MGLMKIEVAKSDLEEALQVVRNTLASGEEMSAHYVFRTAGDKTDQAEVLTYNKRLGSSILFRCTVESEGFKAFTVLGKNLDSFLKSFDGGVVTFSFEGVAVTVNSSEWDADMDFESLDSAKFPYWDKVFEAATATTKCPAERLVAALAYTRHFTLPESEENSNPGYCVAEVVGGLLSASNSKGTASLLEIPELAESKLRIHVTTIGPLMKFLSSMDSGQEVEIRENDRTTFFVRPDGAVFGETRFLTSLPVVKVNRDQTASFWWTLPKDKVSQAIRFLTSGASQEDNRLRFSRPEADGAVVLSMKAKANGKDKTVRIVPADSGIEPDVSVPPEGFVLSYPALLKILDTSAEENVRFNVILKKTSGYVVFREKRGSDDYFTVSAWIRA